MAGGSIFHLSFLIFHLPLKRQTDSTSTVRESGCRPSFVPGSLERYFVTGSALKNEK
jgi:hypothetical protein